MKLLFDAKTLGDALNRIDFSGGEYVDEVTCLKDGLLLTTNERALNIPCIVRECPIAHIRLDRRWDWLAKVLCNTDERPVVLTITDKRIQLIQEF